MNFMCVNCDIFYRMYSNVELLYLWYAADITRPTSTGMLHIKITSLHKHNFLLCISHQLP